jgi:hypothetical protein
MTFRAGLGIALLCASFTAPMISADGATAAPAGHGFGGHRPHGGHGFTGHRPPAGHGVAGRLPPGAMPGVHPRDRHVWRGRDGFRRHKGFGPGFGWGAGFGFGADYALVPPAFDQGIGSGWGAMNSWSAPAAVAPSAPELVVRLPTVADLPVAGVRTEPPGPPTLFVVNDMTRGTSQRPGGARIISVSKPRIIGADGGAYGSSATAPRIIELTAR